jgi:hypothetical protein
MSKFRRDTIAPDYTKKVHQISALAAVTIMRDNLPSYVAYDMWQRTADKTRPSWILDLESMCRARRGKLITESRQSTIEQAVVMSHGIAPITEISADLSGFIAGQGNGGK